MARVRSRGPGEIVSLTVGRARELGGIGETLIVLTLEVVGAEGDSGPELSFREAQATDGLCYARAIGTDSASTFARRRSPTTRCFLVEVSGRIAHSSWVTTSAAWTRELDGYLRPPPGDAYVYESYTRPDVRGRGIYPFALANIAGWGHQRGLGRLWIAVESGNRASLRAITKAGFAPAYELPYGRKLGRVTVGTAEGPLAGRGHRALALSRRA